MVRKSKGNLEAYELDSLTKLQNIEQNNFTH